MSTYSHGRRPFGAAALSLAVAVALVACGSSDGDGRAPAAAAPSTEAATVVEPATAATASPTTTPATASPTTIAPTTTTTTSPPIVVPTTLPLPVPVAPPIDDEAPEPVVELGRVSIPAIGIDRTLYEGIRLPTFDLGPGHWPGTAEPGQRGNVVIGGHRTEGAADFRDLDKLQPGDQMVLTGPDGTAYTYAVEASRITSPFAAQIVYQTQEKTASLFACHPPGSTKQRIVVDLRLVTS